ncbi:MAG: acyl-CoA thioesterase/bile acid-CoA:amino acid N-acyltransferase family protein [Bacteroidota bacterium]
MSILRLLFLVLSLPSGLLLAQDPMVELRIGPDSSLYHRPLHIEVAQLPPGQKVVFQLEVLDAKDHRWTAEAHYRADAQGRIDLAQAPSVGGSYLGIYPMGLFWSLKSTDYHQIATNQGLRATLRVSADGVQLTQKSFYRRSSRELDVLGIRGFAKRDSIVANYYLPKSEQKLPAIIFLGGSGGNFRQERTSLYASEGFATLDLKYFKGEGLPDGIVEIPLEYVRKAHRWLLQQPQIDPHKIGIVGRSRGSELAMLYATQYAVDFVIAQVPSNVVWFGWAEGKSSWTFGGIPYAYAEYSAADSERLEREMADRGEQYRDGPKFLSAFQSEEQVVRATIPVEKIQGPLLLISGEDDQVWPSTMMANRIVQRLVERDFPYEFLHLSYASAGHNFAGGGQGCGIPYLPAEDYSNSSARGGTDRGNALAAADSWQQILRFIHRHLAD